MSGVEMKKRVQINGSIIFACLFLLVLFPLKFLRLGHGSTDDILEIVGLSFILFGQLLRVTSRGYKSENSSNGHRLIKDGPYGVVRNPMYLGIIFISLGIVLMLFQIWVVVLFITFFLIRYISLINKEEKNLIKMFGQEYINYQKKVPRLFPSITTFFNKDISEFLPLKLFWIKKEIKSIVPLLLAVFAIEFWEEIWARNFKGLIYEFVPFSAVMIMFLITISLLARRYENISRETKNNK
jgi:protein-S-isoprenylcysteine O-methyltransferase Ste14